ncbi:HNH endonuclease [Pseudanabaena sp. PCC 6802]|uniref:HNH endonuclease n=1 Tax=Pseudanabaena sp. PCC 6802 TaxID=118173 RepID=UPI00034AE768|nr:HNH endonuclease [Pseudanabaena sp. PCC 6802]
MRPIERGNTPTDNAGSPRRFQEYQNARGDLIDRLGEYCSYCEMHLDASLAVEHVQPKSLNVDLELEWNNFLLGCSNCNSTKKDKSINLDDYYWPDRDNTYRAFEYSKGGFVSVSSSLTEPERQRARATIELTGLDKISLNNLHRSDRRQINRREAWDIAERSLKNLNQRDSLEMREQIVETAIAKGFWSIWMTVFRDDPDMLDRFINAFPGTCKNCFDLQGKPTSRPGGML